LQVEAEKHVPEYASRPTHSNVKHLEVLRIPIYNRAWWEEEYLCEAPPDEVAAVHIETDCLNIRNFRHVDFVPPNRHKLVKFKQFNFAREPEIRWYSFTTTRMTTLHPYVQPVNVILDLLPAGKVALVHNQRVDSAAVQTEEHVVKGEVAPIFEPDAQAIVLEYMATTFELPLKPSELFSIHGFLDD
jgi:hypothetical protein